MLAPVFSGEIKDGKLILQARDAFHKYLATIEGRVTVLVKKEKKQRSTLQNNLYWLYVTMIAEEQGDIDKMKVHELLKQILLKEVVYLKGKEYQSVRSSTVLSTKEFTEYIENIKIWASSELGMVLPESYEIG